MPHQNKCVDGSNKIVLKKNESYFHGGNDLCILSEISGRLEMKTLKYIAYHCPKCDNDFFKIPEDRLEEFKKNQSKPVSERQVWQCDECLAKLMFNFESNVIQVLEDNHPNSSSRTLTLLKLDPSHEPVYIIVKGNGFHDKDGNFKNQQEYYYEQHTCPTNYLQDIFKIYEGTDGDPHGLFKFVKSIQLTEALKQLDLTRSELEDIDDHHHHLIGSLFPEIIPDYQPAIKK